MRQLVSRLAGWVMPLLVCAVVVDCGGTTTDGNPQGPDGRTDVGPCDAGGACPSGSACYFAIGSCLAGGRCISDAPPGTAMCNSVEILCGCDGQQVYSGCGYPGGYASGPTMGDSSCGSTTEDGGLPEEAGPPEGGTDLGPCARTTDCASGSSCYFPIGSCSATGSCIEDATGPVCGALEILCGCDGEQVYSGCGYPSGYASGPTAGSSFCDGGP